MPDGVFQFSAMTHKWIYSPTKSGWEAIEYNLGLIYGINYTKYSREGIAEGNISNKSANVTVSLIKPNNSGFPAFVNKYSNFYF